MGRRGLAVLIVLLAASSAGAEELRNPDVPFGPLAVDLFFNRSLGGEIDIPDSPVPGALEITEFGGALLLPVGSTTTFMVSAKRFTQYNGLLGVQIGGYSGIMLQAKIRIYSPPR